MTKNGDGMNNFEIGKRIKDRRLALGLTQSQLTDGYMTRNMLSLIEAGNALPSLDTAEYLAKKLGIPLSYLLAEDRELRAFERRESVNTVRELFADGKYQECLDAFSKIDELDNELNYIYAYASFYLGKSMTNDGSLDRAVKHLNEALKKSKETIYDTSVITAAAPLYLAVATNVQSPLLELDTEKYESARLSAFDYELYKYLTGDLDFAYASNLLKLHTEAKTLMKKYRFYDAIEILRKTEELKTTEYNAFVLFGVYSDLEGCYKQLGDFENAYRYSSKKFNLLNALGK